jgi:hypothetical protein
MLSSLKITTPLMAILSWLWDFFRFPTPEEIGKGKQVRYVILIDKTLSSLGAVMVVIVW